MVSKGTLWEDDSFPASEKSLGKLKTGAVEWKRPKVSEIFIADTDINGYRAFQKKILHVCVVSW